MQYRRKRAIPLTVVLIFLAYSLFIYFHIDAPMGLAHTQTGKYSISFISSSSNDPSGNIDPGKDKDVGWTTTKLVDSNGDGLSDKVIVRIGNAYPCYSSVVTATILNSGTLPVRIASVDVTQPPEITVSRPDLVGFVINPGEWVNVSFSVHVKQQALENHTYSFCIKITASTPIYGTIGFWKNWNKHKTFTQQQILSWLTTIDAQSLWLGPTTIEGMESVLNNTSGSNARAKFLGHYLATRLNAESSILNVADTHNVTSYDPNNYLGLERPHRATLTEIIAAIESKYNTSPTRKQFEIMKNICDGINNLKI